MRGERRLKSSIKIILFISLLLLIALASYRIIPNLIENYLDSALSDEESNHTYADEEDTYLEEALSSDGATTVKENEVEQVHQFISNIHQQWNDIVGWGGYQNLNFEKLADVLKETEAEILEIKKLISDERIIEDLENAKSLFVIGVEQENQIAIVYVHRIFHDLDIIYNGYSNNKGFGGYSNLDQQGSVKVEQLLKEFKES
ncbi:hypothetical protein BTS2_4100 [Bacillus sp. TS-2]|nr:hypothetical protein BTS2_4100 [Bacillus sp. TS-2]